MANQLMCKLCRLLNKKSKFWDLHTLFAANMLQRRVLLRWISFA